MNTKRCSCFARPRYGLDGRGARMDEECNTLLLAGFSDPQPCLIPYLQEHHTKVEYATGAAMQVAVPLNAAIGLGSQYYGSLDRRRAQQRWQNGNDFYGSGRRCYHGRCSYEEVLA